MGIGRCGGAEAAVVEVTALGVARTDGERERSVRSLGWREQWWRVCPVKRDNRSQRRGDQWVGAGVLGQGAE